MYYGFSLWTESELDKIHSMKKRLSDLYHNHARIMTRLMTGWTVMDKNIIMTITKIITNATPNVPNCYFEAIGKYQVLDNNSSPDKTTRLTSEKLKKILMQPTYIQFPDDPEYKNSMKQISQLLYELLDYLNTTRPFRHSDEHLNEPLNELYHKRAELLDKIFSEDAKIIDESAPDGEHCRIIQTITSRSTKENPTDELEFTWAKTTNKSWITYRFSPEEFHQMLRTGNIPACKYHDEYYSIYNKIHMIDNMIDLYLYCVDACR